MTRANFSSDNTHPSCEGCQPDRHGINYGGATAEDLITYAQWELREIMDSLPPDPADKEPRGRPVDGFHAGCCAMRADSALRQLGKLIADGRQTTPMVRTGTVQP